MTPRHFFPLLFAITLALAMSLPASAERTPRPGSVEAVRATAESALMVTGTIDIDAAGKVLAFTIDLPEKLPPGIVKMANDNASAWTFEPITLPAGMSHTRSRVSMLFVARQLQGDQYEVTLRHTSFRTEGASAMRLKGGALRLEYPPEAAARGVPATVYAVVRVDRSGKVLEAAIEQVNLGAADTEAQMAIWRELFGTAVLRSRNSMRIEVPDGIFDEGEQTVVARLPVVFRMAGSRYYEYGRWNTYVPGPRATIPWPDAESLTRSPPDALPPDLLNARDRMGRTLRESSTP